MDEDKTYQDEIRIDPESLDVECLEQPEKMLKYTGMLATASKRVDKAKEILDIVRAECSMKVRKNPGKYSIEKITADALETALSTMEEYREANKLVILRKFEYEVLNGAVRAFEQRKKMLELLVTLHGQRYFSGPAEPRDLKTMQSLKAKRVGSKIRRRLEE